MRKVMKKEIIIQQLKPVLQKRGYRKRGYYWYKSQNGIIFCLNIQGSQWSKDDYYVNVGVAKEDTMCKFPTILNWVWRHRCKGEKGEINMDLQDIVTCMDKYFSAYIDADSPNDFYRKFSAECIAEQYWL